MSNMISRNVDDLPAASRRGIEQLLGAELQPHERVYIVVDLPPSGPAEPVRIQAAKRIREIFGQAEANSETQRVASAEIDSAVQEAMDQIRRRI